MMKTQSTFSVICTLIILLCALISLPLNSWSKTGEQNNWYLSKEESITLSGNEKSIKFWKDPTDNEFKILKISPSFDSDTYGQLSLFLEDKITFDQIQGHDGIHNFDSSTVFKFESPLSIISVYDYAILPDNTIMMIADVQFDWPLENPYPFKSLLHANLVEKKAKVLLGDTDGNSWTSLCYGGNDKLVLSGSIEDPLSDNSIAPSSVPYFQVFKVSSDSSSNISISNLQNFYVQSGTAPGLLQEIKDVEITFDDRIAVLSNNFINFFSLDGNFSSRSESSATFLEVAQKGYFISDYKIYNHFGGEILDLSGSNGIWPNKLPGDSKALAMSDDGDLFHITQKSVTIGNDTSYTTVFQKWNRAYRTKGLLTPNKIPQPLVHQVKQRPGTNILDIDFEILDTDDSTAIAGLIATVNLGLLKADFNDPRTLIIPSALADGTENKIGQAIATNKVHRVSWYVKGDWNKQVGELKIGILCRDERRSKSVDLHFLKIPYEQQTLTISRSPILDSDILNFLLFEMASGGTQFSLSTGMGNIKDLDGNDLYKSFYTVNGNVIYGSTEKGRQYFIDALGYRWATDAEVNSALEAYTPGNVNKWVAVNPILPRNIPGTVNEYGFNSSAGGGVFYHSYNWENWEPVVSTKTGTRGWWVVK